MAKSTYYYEISKTDLVAERNEELSKEIERIFWEHKGRYGVRRITAALRNLGYSVNHKRVQRLMKDMGLKGLRPQVKYHSYKGKVGEVAENVINRDFHATAPLQKWSTDITQFTFPWGKCFFSPIMDMYTNEIIAFGVSQSPGMPLIQTMAEGAFIKHPNLQGLIFHSDQGWQYQHPYFVNALRKRGIIQSMSRKGNCYDNSIMETFFGRMKVEMFFGFENEYKSFEEFSKAVRKYIYYYNNERIQAKTNWMPPTAYRLASNQ